MYFPPTVLSSVFIFLITVALLRNRAPKKITRQPRLDETRRKGPVFRVTGLPASQADGELAVSLKAAINDDLGEDERSKMTVTIAILPSCYNDAEKVALVEFHGGVPAFLSELQDNPLGDWQIEIGDTHIIFDQHFFGFTQLYSPKANSFVSAEYNTPHSLNNVPI
jgi:hypothetical protein